MPELSRGFASTVSAKSRFHDIDVRNGAARRRQLREPDAARRVLNEAA